MRHRGRVDGNQSLIVRALRDAGASVLVISSIGSGCPDLLIGKNQVNFLAEIKDPTKVHSQRKLTEDEVQFHNSWRGQVCVIETVKEALRLIECS